MITKYDLKDYIISIIYKNNDEVKILSKINLNKVKTKKIFKWLKENNIKDEEMLKTFNCGVGFCLIINPKNLTKVKNFFTSEFEPYIIGKIVSGKNKVRLDGKIDWS